MTTWAFYQAYYGGDRLQLSLETVLPQVDKVLVFWSERPWFDLTSVQWKGEALPIPEDVDGIVRFAQTNTDPRIECVHYHRRECVGRVTAIVNEHILPRADCPDFLLYLATDYALQDNIVPFAREHMRETGQRFLSFTPITLWRYFSYRYPAIPNRCGAILMNLQDGLRRIQESEHEIGLNPEHWLHGHTIDMSLASTPHTMLWKHLLRTAQARLIPDDLPVENWFERDWLPWTPDIQRNDLGWCESERDRSVEPMALHELPTALRLLAEKEQIPDRYARMSWKEILSCES